MTGGVLSTAEEANTMGRTIMDLLRGGRWARGGLLAATFAMGASLVVTSLLSYRSVVHASGLVSRSQGEALLRSTFFLVRPGQDPPERSTLAALLEEQAAAGLRYVAIFDSQARVTADAGSPLASPPLSLSPAGDRDSRAFLDLGKRIRMIAGPPPPPPERTGRGATGASEPPRRPRLTIAIEFEPLVARQLSAQAARALGFGVVAAFGLMAVALLFSRQLLRQEAAERRFENQRRLLLDFSRSGPIDRKAADPAALLRAAADSVDASRIVLSLEDAPHRFHLDAERVRQALTNLLLNAVQASPAGALATARVATEGDALVFTVRDRGPGIPPADLERIFEPFYTTRPTGTGLGLAVAQRIVQMHGGTLTAANDPEGGASFRMAIPRA